MGFLGGKSKEEVLNEFRRELEELRLQLEERMDKRISSVERALIEVLENVRKLERERAFPEEFLTKVSEAAESAESVVRELKIIREYKEWFDSIKEGLNDILELLSRERTMLREDVEKLIKERSELETLKSELKKWKADLEEKEYKLSNFNAYVNELEEKKNRIEAELKDLSQRYLVSLEGMLRKIDEEVNRINRMFKLKEIRLERIAKRERELSDALMKIKEREEMARELENRMREMSEEISRLEAKKAKLLNDINELTERKLSLEKLVGEFRKAILAP
ncbi:MAG: hypothetical protein RMJ14_01720 [Nitrososphaerota archaeon]|nr:hypothetical protein [Aigarchaeota archaeon]MDW8076342.1 hypothetical protein [Nitrososphaerota archaeon]